MSVLTENWYTWYFKGADSKSGLRFLKFRPQNPFWGKFGPEKVKVVLLFQKIGTHGISAMLNLIPTLLFSVPNPKSFFAQIGSKNSKFFILT